MNVFVFPKDTTTFKVFMINVFTLKNLFYFWCVYQYCFCIFFHFVQEKYCPSKIHWHSTFFWKKFHKITKIHHQKNHWFMYMFIFVTQFFFSSWKIWILSPICICIWTHMSIYHAYPSVCLPSKLGRNDNP